METLLLPKVSVVIINYNYETYLDAAYASVAGQTYPNIEILIVDDCSTDGSGAKIDEICARDPRVVAVKLSENGGQPTASLRGLSASSGAYVVFLDSDDQLLPQCVEAHVYAHLSSRIPVALSAVDVLNNVDGQDVNTSTSGFGEYVEAGNGRRPSAVRPVHESLGTSWFGTRRPVIDVAQLHFVLPPQVESWVWSPSSAMCYRRDAVSLLLREPGLKTIKGTDVFLVRPLSALFGSILIDAPLMRYIKHSGNYFSRGAPLHNFLAFERSSEERNTSVATAFAVKRLMADVETSGARYLNPFAFFDALKALCESWPVLKGESGGDFYVEQLIANRAALTAGFGPTVVAEELARRNIEPKSEPSGRLGKRAGFLQRSR